MLSFVRRLNPFRKQSNVVPPPNITTRSVQTDLNGPRSRQRPEAADPDVTRKGINKLLQEFQKENFHVATLMDHEGKIYFTIDLTEIILKDAELDHMVRLVQKSVRNPSKGALHNKNSDEMAKKLKRHFLFESIKNLTGEQKNKMSLMLSDSYHTADRINGGQAHSPENVTVRERINEPNKFNITPHETEIQSHLYGANSSRDEEDSVSLMESLKSSLATKLYKKIEQTIDSLKKKHKQEVPTNVSIIFSRHCNPVKDPKQREHVDTDFTDTSEMCYRRDQIKEKLKERLTSRKKESKHNYRQEKKQRHAIRKLRKRDESNVSKNNNTSLDSKAISDYDRKRRVNEKGKSTVVANVDIDYATRQSYGRVDAFESDESIERKLKDRLRSKKRVSTSNRLNTYTKNKRDKYHRQSSCTYKELRKLNERSKKKSHKRSGKKSEDKIREHHNRIRPKTRHKSRRDDLKLELPKLSVDHKEMVRGKSPVRDDLNLEFPKLSVDRKEMAQDKPKREETRKVKHRKPSSNHLIDDKKHKTKPRTEKSKYRKRKEVRHSEKRVQRVFSGPNNVDIIFDDNDRKEKKTNYKSKGKDNQDRGGQERCPFTSSESSQVERNFLRTESGHNLERTSGSSEKLIAVVSFGPPGPSRAYQ